MRCPPPARPCVWSFLLSGVLTRRGGGAKALHATTANKALRDWV